MFTSARNRYKVPALVLLLILAIAGLVFAKKKYSEVDFGTAFTGKYEKAAHILINMKPQFEECSKLCRKTPLFLQSIVLPEVMRYNTLKDGIEAESLRTLYVQMGQDYADFSIGLFQMKPSFAEQIEEQVQKRLPIYIQKELSLSYQNLGPEDIRRVRVERMLDKEWQLIYLTAFTLICDSVYNKKIFQTELDRLLWYATIYNAGMDKNDIFIENKLRQSHFYLGQQMPGRKFNYAAIVEWYYRLQKAA